MWLIDQLLCKIELILTLPEMVSSAFERNQKKIPLTNGQQEKLALFLPLLNFPAIALQIPTISILLLFFLFLVGPKKAQAAIFIEQSFLLSIGSLFPEYAPYVFLWMVASWILSTHTPTFSFGHSMHRFFWMAAVLIYPPFLFLFAPILAFSAIILGIHSKFLVWSDAG